MYNKYLQTATTAAGSAMEQRPLQKRGVSENPIVKSRVYFMLLAAMLFLFSASVSAQNQSSKPDIITLRSGDDVEAIVQKVGDTNIEYKKWSNKSDGPTYTLKKSEIFKISYANGEKEVFVKEPAVTTVTTVTTVTPETTTASPTTTIAQSNTQNVTNRTAEVSGNYRGAKSLGASVVFGSGDDFSNTGVQAKFRYGLSDALRLEGSFIYFIKNTESIASFEDNDGFYECWDVSSFDFSVNLHYYYSVSEQFALYPLAGLGVIGWNGTYPEMEEKSLYGGVKVKVATGKDAHYSATKFGFNIGAGIDYKITDKISANAEFRYRHGEYIWKRTYFSLGILYNF